jgi:hypothetical protein
LAGPVDGQHHQPEPLPEVELLMVLPIRSDSPLVISTSASLGVFGQQCRLIQRIGADLNAIGFPDFEQVVYLAFHQNISPPE